MTITVTSRSFRRRVRKIQRAARDGMWLSVLALVAIVVFSHPGHQELLVIAIGLAGIFCSRLSAGSRPAAQRPPAARMSRPRVQQRQYSPECLPGSREHGSCSGVGCDCDCGHPGKSRSRKQTVPDDQPPF